MPSVDRVAVELDFEDWQVDAVDEELLGIDPTVPVEAYPGSWEKVQMLAARYAAGLPLWHEDDCDEHEGRTRKKQKHEQPAVS